MQVRVQQPDGASALNLLETVNEDPKDLEIQRCGVEFRSHICSRSDFRYQSMPNVGTPKGQLS